MGESMFRIIPCCVTKVRHVQSHSSLPQRCSVEQRGALRRGTKTQPQPKKSDLSPSQRNPQSGCVKQHQRLVLATGEDSEGLIFSLRLTIRLHMANKNVINTFLNCHIFLQRAILKEWTK